MIRRLAQSALLVCVVAGCAGKPAVRPAAVVPSPAAAFAPAIRVPDAAATVPTAVPGDAARGLGALTARPVEPLRRPLAASVREPASPLARVEAANRSARREPSRAGYANAVQVYDWSEGALYGLYTAPERVSEIALQPGEALVSVAAGDTVRWVVGDTTSGSGPARRTHILVKPTAAGLHTNLVIATDRRVYHVLLESSAGPAMASISWTYPQDALLVLGQAPQAQREVPATAGPSVESLNFGYRIEGDNPSWRPLRAFDDGSQVFIEFPQGLARDQAPPLFVSGNRGRPELVNYRVRGRFYVVDRLFARAELRLGEKRQQVVRIVADGSRRRGGSDR